MSDEFLEKAAAGAFDVAMDAVAKDMASLIKAAVGECVKYNVSQAEDVLVEALTERGYEAGEVREAFKKVVSEFLEADRIGPYLKRKLLGAVNDNPEWQNG